MDRDGIEETCLEKTYFTTEESFPTVLKRSEIVAFEVNEITPVEIALAEVVQKNKELAAVNMKYSALAKAAQDISTNPLTMALNSVVDVPAGAGISSYRTSFFAPEYATKHPERGEFVDKLRSAVDQQVCNQCQSPRLTHSCMANIRSASSIVVCDFMASCVHQKC
jgi:dedicator of cytokinesis protein 3